MTKIGEDYIGSRRQRAFDVVTSASLGIATAPLVGATALALGVHNREPRLFLRQERIGMDGKTFDIYKIRTIRGQDRSGLIEEGGSEHPHATVFAKLVRKLGIDELPQSANILLGDLHMVGIRVQTPITLQQRQDADPILFEDWNYWYERNTGVLGPGQNLAHRFEGTYSENSALIRDVMRVDIEGCEKASLGNDIKCLIQTPASLMQGAAQMIRNNIAQSGEAQS